MLLGGIYRRPDDDVTRMLVFIPGSDALCINLILRRRGRPRLNWCQEVYKHAVVINGGSVDIGVVMMNEVVWRKLVRNYCR